MSRFSFYCDSSLNDNNSHYNVMCKYHQNLYDPIRLPKTPQFATNRCFTKIDYNNTEWFGVSEYIY